MADPVFASLEWYLAAADTVREIYREELFREPEPGGLFNWIFHAREEGKDGAWIRDEVRQSPEWHAIHDLPPAPTRDQVCGVKLTFQGLTVNGVPWFEPWIQAVGMDRQAVYAAKRAAGDTHVIVELLPAEPIYNEPPFDRFVSPDFEANPAAFRALVEEIIKAGFIPIVAFNGDNGDSPVDGHPNALRQLPILAELFKSGRDITPYILFARLYDGVFYGSAPANIAAFGKAFRQLLPDGYLGIEHNVGHIPVGNGTADWQSDGMMGSYDVLFQEFANWPERGDQIWQIAARVLGPKYKRPADQPAGDDPNPPNYFQAGSARGPYFPIAFEYAEYDWVRGRIAAADVEAARNYFKSIGYAYIG